jgi:hypothetical protein
MRRASAPLTKHRSPGLDSIQPDLGSVSLSVAGRYRIGSSSSRGSPLSAACNRARRNSRSPAGIFSAIGLSGGILPLRGSTIRDVRAPMRCINKNCECSRQTDRSPCRAAQPASLRSFTPSPVRGKKRAQSLVSEPRHCSPVFVRGRAWCRGAKPSIEHLSPAKSPGRVARLPRPLRWPIPATSVRPLYQKDPALGKRYGVR